MLSFFFFLFPIRELNLLTSMLSHSCARQESGLSNHVEVKVAAIGSDTDMRSPEGLKMNPLGEVSYKGRGLHHHYYCVPSLHQRVRTLARFRSTAYHALPC